MEFISEHPWRKTITQRLTPEQEKHPVETDNSDWEYIENEAAKIGTISHETVNIAHVQEAILKLLSQDTKDFRLIAHFINTLQRSGKPDNILLAIAILADYIEIYWDIAAPQKLKKRIVQMIIQRFSMAKSDFHTNAIQEQRDESTAHFIRLKQALQESYPDLCDEIDKLVVGYGKVPAQTTAAKPASSKTASAKNESSASSTTAQGTQDTELKVLPEITLDPSSEQAWRRTLLKVIEIENSRQPNQPIAFQLRRHIVWFNINSPVANNGLTTVPPVPAEKVNEYERELSRPTVELWQKIENTIAYSPYWFDGHFMSAQIANKLGYGTIADIIKNELVYFLERCPECKTLQYNNGQPFANENTLKWLNKKALSSGNVSHDDHAFTIFESEGLEAAINHLEENTAEQPRDMNYAQLQTVQLLNKAGCYKLAKMQLEHLKENVKQLDVKTWEPAFFEKCDEVEAQIGNKE